MTAAKPTKIAVQGHFDEGVATLKPGEGAAKFNRLAISGEIDALRQAFMLKVKDGLALTGTWQNPIVGPTLAKPASNN